MKKPERTKRPPKHPLYRVHERPNLDQWRGDEPIMLREAVALFFPEGPLTISSFRAAIRRGELASMKLAGKMFTTPDAVREMMRPELRTPPAKVDISRAHTPGTPTDAQMRAAQERALATVREVREKIKEQNRQEAKADRGKRL